MTEKLPVPIVQCQYDPEHVYTLCTSEARVRQEFCRYCGPGSWTNYKSMAPEGVDTSLRIIGYE